jgi:hypothetical protein
VNPRAWILGGLLAGLILNLSGAILAHHVLGPEYIAALRARMVDMPLWLTIGTNVALRLGFGIIGVFLYAAIRPRYGPGPKTALIAALVLWLAAFAPMLVHLAQGGILNGSRMLVVLPWSAAEVCLACLAGAWVYREKKGTT